MKKKLPIYFLLSLSFFSVSAQIVPDSMEVYADTLETLWEARPQTDTVFRALPVDTLTVKVPEPDSMFKPDPAKSLWLGAIIPGFGQVVNKKYWKLPIVYGGFMGFAYAISWNNTRYVSYKNAYRDIIDNDPTTNSHIQILPRGYTLANYPGGVATYTQRLKSAQDQFRQYRDLSIILGIGYYLLVLLEAYVDAQLYDFDISSDLSKVNIAPARIELNQYALHTPAAYGVQWSIRF